MIVDNIKIHKKTKERWNLIKEVITDKGITAKELGSRLGMNRSNAMQILNTLLRYKLLRREISYQYQGGYIFYINQ